MKDKISIFEPIISIVTDTQSIPFFNKQKPYIKGLNHILDIHGNTLDLLKSQRLIFIIINPQNGNDKEIALEIKSKAQELKFTVIMMEVDLELNTDFSTPLQPFEELKSNMNGLIGVGETTARNGNLLHSLIFIKTISAFFYQDGLFKQDNFEQIYSIFENAGMSSLGYANAKGEAGSKMATTSAILQLLSEDRDALYSANHLFLNIISGKDSVLDENEVEEIRRLISQFTSDSADIFISVSNAAKIDKDVIHISILCTAKHQ